MTFKRVPGLKGQLYIPEKKDGKTGKHNCVDCFSCQMCSDVRCEICRCEKESQYNKNPSFGKVFFDAMDRTTSR